MAYTEVDQETFLGRKAQSDSRVSGDWKDTWKPQIGAAGSPKRHKIRLMPPHEKMNKDPFVELLMHFFPSREIGKDGRPIPIGVPCLGDARWQEECPGCSYVKRLLGVAQAEDDPETAERQTKNAKDQAAKMRFFANIVDMDHPDKGVQRYAMGPDVEKKIRGCFFNDDGEYRNITHPQTGRNIILTAAYKKGTSGFVDYAAKPAEAAEALKDMDWLEQIHDLTDAIKKPSVEALKAATRGERTKETGAKDVTKDGKAATKPATPPAEAAVAAAPPATPPPAAAPVTPPKPKREPVTDDTPSDPWSKARAACTKAGFATPADIDPAIVDGLKKPNCFTKEPDPGDPMCQGCRVLLPCLTAKMAAA